MILRRWGYSGRCPAASSMRILKNKIAHTHTHTLRQDNERRHRKSHTTARRRAETERNDPTREYEAKRIIDNERREIDKPHLK